jgi:hypothetical protein
VDLERQRDRERYAQIMEYASPAGMILEATAARLAGDWRAACAAAAVDVRVDPLEVSVRFGTEPAAMLEAELAGFAPDFLRRHLPRTRTGALRPGMLVVLAREAVRMGRGVPVPVVRLPYSEDAPQRLVFRVMDSGDLPDPRLWLAPWTWQAGAVEERRWAYGPFAGREPWRSAEGVSVPGDPGVDPPGDAALLRWGTLIPDQLHPLVHEALFPDRVQDWQPLLHDPCGAYRVRCGTDWHIVEGIGASVRTPHHDEAELRREPAAGCARAVAGFLTGEKPVPKALRKHRQRIFARAFHGDTDGLLTDLAAGCDPRFRDVRGRSLMQWIGHVDRERVRPVLLAAGLSGPEAAVPPPRIADLSENDQQERGGTGLTWIRKRWRAVWPS